MKAGASSTSTLGWKSSAPRWHLNNISTKLEIFSMRLASQQHQHKVGNLQHEAGINKISMKLEILSMSLASTTSTRS
jgi:hypothetical protein